MAVSLHPSFLTPRPTQLSKPRTPSEEPQEVLGECDDVSRYFLQRNQSLKRRKSVRITTSTMEPLSPTESETTSPSMSPGNSPNTFSTPPSPIDFLLRRSPSLTSHFNTKQDKIRGRVTVPNVVNEVSSKEEDCNQDSHVASSISKMKRGNGVYHTGPHFRPIPYEVKAEMDAFFGQTKGQRRELALRTRDEDGHLWFDRIEQEEFAKLISSSPNSPISNFSRRSSATDSPCLSPTFGRPRQASVVIGAYPVTILTPFEGEETTLLNYVPACLHISPLYTRNGLSVPLDSRERRRRRSPSDLRRGNVVVDNEPLQGDTESNNQSEEEISMPAFLPLRRQANVALLEEAFPSCIAEDDPSMRGEMDEFKPTALTSRTTGRKGHRPSHLDLHFKNFEEVEKAAIRRLRQRASLSLSPYSDGSPLSNGYEYERRRSSFDSPSTSSPQLTRMEQKGAYMTATGSPLFDLPVRAMERKQKAATILGKTVDNERLLAPGGLPTGEHVYDGLDIPCRSVHLQSDDEEEYSIKPKKSFGSVKAWLKKKGV